MPWSQYLEQAILNEVFGATSFSAPGTIYWGLSTQAVSGATQANVLSGEPSSTGGYGRASQTNNTTNFPNASGAGPASKTNGTAFNIGASASSAAWSTGSTQLILLFAVDSSTLGAGNVLGWGALSTPAAVNSSGIQFQFAIGSVTLSLT